MLIKLKVMFYGAMYDYHGFIHDLCYKVASRHTSKMLDALDELERLSSKEEKGLT